MGRVQNLDIMSIDAETDLDEVGLGESGARYILCDDGEENVVKYKTNQGKRLFINEFTGAFTSKLMSCSTPDFDLIKFDADDIK